MIFQVSHSGNSSAWLHRILAGLCTVSDHGQTFRARYPRTLLDLHTSHPFRDLFKPFLAGDMTVTLNAVESTLMDDRSGEARMTTTVVGAKGQKFPLLGISFLGIVHLPPLVLTAAFAGAVIIWGSQFTSPRETTIQSHSFHSPPIILLQQLHGLHLAFFFFLLSLIFIFVMSRVQNVTNMEGDDSSVRQRHSQAAAKVDTSLQQMGIKSDLDRNSFSNISMLGMAFSIVNTWCAIGTTVNASLPSGGASSAVWGIVVAGIFNFCSAVSLAEFLSAYPTAGGQYHWAAVASPAWMRRGGSYITGWINLAAWICLAGANCLLVSGIIMGYAQLVYPSFEPRPWQRFLLYVAIDFIALGYNLFANRFLSHLNKYNMFFTLAGFIMSLTTILACAAPNFKSASFVFGGFINESGWPDGWAWQLGLLQG